ncbi:MAG TPA: hypothetical protein VM537_21295 [Anaerolineae bacterium]|nr:hypothetical protein [Anaerolineae bacterium]
MTTYHQMGHGSVGLLSEDRLRGYRGAILSPVNYSEAQIQDQIAANRRSEFELIFDPQLYYPGTNRGKLPDWSYFPAGVETGDLSSLAWWTSLVGHLASVTSRLHPDSICSPAAVPRVYSPEYYDLNRRIADSLVSAVEGEDVGVLQTVLARLETLSQPNVAAEVASVASRCTSDRVYLVLVSDIGPRREFRGTEDLKGAMRLINYLEAADIRVLVAYTSSDVILWKAAGASECATGKFFNLRRFTSSRWEPPPEGGGQLSYWMEESMMAFLRESDLIRVRHAGLLAPASLSNPYGTEILNSLDNSPGESWLALGWRQYMYWLCDFEKRLDSGTIVPEDALRNAEQVWDRLEAPNILMEERPNDGGWLRPWRRALAEALP